MMTALRARRLEDRGPGMAASMLALRLAPDDARRSREGDPGARGPRDDRDDERYSHLSPEVRRDAVLTLDRRGNSLSTVGGAANKHLNIRRKSVEVQGVELSRD